MGRGKRPSAASQVSMRPQYSPNEVGLICEAEVLPRLLRLGYVVSKPFGDTRYDYIIDRDGVLERAQVKSGKTQNGCVVFNTSSNYYHNRTAGQVKSASYRGQIDVFLVYCEDTNAVYRVPVQEVADGKGYLRLDPTLNGQQQGVRWAHHYLLT